MCTACGAFKTSRWVDGVPELAILLHAEVTYDVGVNIGFPEQFHLTVGNAEAVGEDSLHGHVTIVEAAAVYERAFAPLA